MSAAVDASGMPESTPIEPPKSRRRQTTISVVTLTVVYLAFTLTFSLLTRAWEANDEPDHVQYAELILLNGRLPEIGPSQGDESHQPPLYYLALDG